MKERPILFMGEMVRAILEGRKTQTRRITKTFGFDLHDKPIIGKCRYGIPGDRLWVKETWRPAFDDEAYCCVEYKADGSRVKPVGLTEDQGHKFADDCPDVPGVNVHWRPSIFMPRWASRIMLEVVSVRVERLQDISEEDAKAEGVYQTDGADRYYCMAERKGGVYRHAKDAYRELWESINGTGSWASNPFVWVVAFRRVT